MRRTSPKGQMMQRIPVNRFLLYVAAFLSIFSFTTMTVGQKAFAQVGERLEIPSSFNPVGSGARALGMGGSFIAVADDATAASWNPGGLIQLETPEISAVGSFYSRHEDLSFGTNPEASGSESITESNVNYLSAAYPFHLFKRNMIVSINYQHLYDFHRDWNVTLRHGDGSPSYQQNVKYKMQGRLSAIGLAYAIQVTPRISMGFTLNKWDNGLSKNEWEAEDVNTWTQLDSGPGPSAQRTIDYTRWEFNGFNYNLGFLWNVNYRITLGGVFKAPFTADLDRHEDHFEFEDDMDTPVFYSDASKDQDLDMPMSYGLGFGYRFSDKLTASFDIYRTEWGDFILTDEAGNKTSAISLKSEKESNVDPTIQIRAGMEYLNITNKFVIPFRGGVFYDPAPAEGSPDDYYGFSIGSGLAKARFVWDIAYQYRFGNGVTDYIYENLDFSQDVKEHMLYSSIIFHF
jgi:long-subunit fatty acid transport protein